MARMLGDAVDPAVRRRIRAELERGGHDSTFTRFLLRVGVLKDGQGRIVPLDDEVPVCSGDRAGIAFLPPGARLFEPGDRSAPDFSSGPSPAFKWRLYLVESTAVSFADVAKRAEVDLEYARLYRKLARNVDARDENRLLGYLRAAIRLGLALFETSRMEYEAMMEHLALSVEAVATSPTSTAYHPVIVSRIECDPAFQERAVMPGASGPPGKILPRPS